MSEETIDALSKVTSFDREKISITNLNTLRYELEALYDMYHGSVVDSEIELYVNGEECNDFGDIQEAYSLFMNDLEQLINKNN